MKPFAPPPVDRWISRALGIVFIAVIATSGAPRVFRAVEHASAQVSSEILIYMPLITRSFDVSTLPQVPTAEPTPTPTLTPTPIPTDTPIPEPTATPGPPLCRAPLDTRLAVRPLEVGEVGVVRPGRRDFFTGQPILAAARDETRSAIAWPGGDGNIHVTPLNGVGRRDGDDAVMAGQSLHGFVAHPDGSGAVLVRRGRSMTLVGYSADGSISFETETLSAAPASGVGNKWIDDWTHEGRLVWTGAGYTAYFGHTQQWPDGNHQGDLLWHYDANGQKISRAEESWPGWDWGCSHSLDVRLAHNAESDVICPVCLSDCYPQKAILHTHKTLVSSEPSGDCSGGSDALLGGLVVTESGFALTYASKVGRSSRDIALTTIGADGAVGKPVWLTDTPGVDEASAHLARYGEDHFLAGWKNDSGLVLAVLDESGSIVDGPTAVEVDIERRDDFITMSGGDVTWGFAESDGSELYHVVVPYCIPTGSP